MDTIRPAVESDVQDILRIGDAGWRATYGDFLRTETIDEAIDTWYDPDMIREQIADNVAAYYVAEQNDEVLGYVSGGPAEEAGVTILGAIYVNPDYRGEGIGTALLSEFEQYCRDQGNDTIRFHVFADFENGPAYLNSAGVTGR